MKKNNLLQKTILIYGLGLIGGSIAKKIKSIDKNINIIAITNRDKTAIDAKNLEIVDDASDNIDILKKYSPNFIILCTPPNQNLEIIKKLYPFISTTDEILITDVSSVKGSIYYEIEKFIETNNKKYNKKIDFIGSHPMAGTEKKGLENSFENLLDYATVFITPFENYKNSNFLNLLNDFWLFLETNPKIISVENHDIFTGFTSHFSHIVSALQTNLIFDEAKKNPDIISAISSSFNGITRISNSDPNLWTEIVISNNKNLINIIQKYKKHIEIIENILKNNNQKEILNFFSQTKSNKQFLSKK